MQKQRHTYFVFSYLVPTNLMPMISTTNKKISSKANNKAKSKVNNKQATITANAD